MCGIAGEIVARTQITDNMHIEAMIQSLSHRGPDERQYFISHPLGTHQINLGMCRLSIIDRERGQQPFGDTCKVMFNGEIYNHKTLRDQVEAPQYRLATDCDSEVVAFAYDCWSDDFVDHLDGMYAIAIWDEELEQLKLFRDPVGKKPLYYYHGDKFLLFASEIKAIVGHPLFKKEINEVGIWQYMCLQYVPEPMTAYKGIFTVPPGGKLIYDPAGDELRVSGSPIPKPDVADDPDPADYGAWKRLVSGTVALAVSKRLESEVPLGVYLSGGIDSAIITALAASSRKTDDLHTFTMGFLNPEYDERILAKAIAEKYKTIHHEETVESVELVPMAERIVRQYDQPFGDCSAIPTMLLAEKSKQYITVALCGDGGDEAFGGYPRYWMVPDPIKDYFKFMTPWPTTRRADLWPGGFARMGGIDPRQVINPPIEEFGGTRIGMMYSDMLTYLPNDIIVKMERATMAASVEARCPFLDPSVLSLGLRVPENLKIGNDSGKVILKQAFQHLLPAETLKAPKRGFSVPMNEWLRAPEGCGLLGETVLQKDAFVELDGFDHNVMSQLTVAHWNQEVDIGHALWIMVMLEMWLKENFR